MRMMSAFHGQLAELAAQRNGETALASLDRCVADMQHSAEQLPSDERLAGLRQDLERGAGYLRDGRGHLLDTLGSAPLELDLPATSQQGPPRFRATGARPRRYALEPEAGALTAASADTVARGDTRSLAASRALEDIAICSRLRRASHAGPWSRALGRFDERLCRQLDTLFAIDAAATRESPQLEPVVLRALLRFVQHSPAAAPRAFCMALVLGCMRGDEAMRCTLHALRTARPTTRAALIEALSLCPSGQATEALRRATAEPDASTASAALSVLAARGEASVPLLVPLLSHPSAVVRRESVRALGASADPQAAAAVLRPMLADELDDRVVAAVARSLSRLGDPTGAQEARHRIDEEIEIEGALSRRARRELAWLLALGGDAEDHARLLAITNDAPADALIVAWHGHPASIEPLLQRLDEAAMDLAAGADGESGAAAIARALQRITGAMPVRAARRHQRVDAVTPSPRRWRSWWEEHGEHYRGERRMRHGKPYTVEASLDELASDGVPADTRALLAEEIGIALPSGITLRTDDWCEQQLGALEALVEHARAAPPLPSGGWPAQVSGSRRAG
jgi:hypothetical protein